MRKLIDELPLDHFGDLLPEIEKELIKGKSICMTNMPGGGMNYFLKKMERLLTHRKKKVIFLQAPLYHSDFKSVIKKVLIKELSLDPNEDFFLAFEKQLKTQELFFILSRLDTLLPEQANAISFLLQIRDLAPFSLSFLTSVNYSLITKYEDFLKLGENLFYNIKIVPPFDFEGTKRILDINKKIYNLDYSETVYPQIYELSGGNAALIKHLGLAVDRFGTKILESKRALIQFPSLKVKLDEITQAVLQEPIETLVELKIINSKGEIFSPLVKKYIEVYEPDSIKQAFSNLTKKERKILSFFLFNKDKIIDKDKLSFLMGMGENDFSLWAIYKSISRLRTKLEGRYQIINIKNQGYQLQVISRGKEKQRGL